MTEPIFFTCREAAAALDVDPVTIVRWVKSGRMRAHPKRAGRSLIFTGAEVNRVALLPRAKRGRPRRPAPQRETLPGAS